MKKLLNIEAGEWLYKGCFILKMNYPWMAGKYTVMKNNESQDHVGRCDTFKEAKKMCIDNECDDNFYTFDG